jgi:hypothetical protein
MLAQTITPGSEHLEAAFTTLLLTGPFEKSSSTRDPYLLQQELEG